MFFPTQVRAHHSGSRRMPTRWPANCSVSPGSCDSLERAPGLRRPGCSSGAAPSTRPRRPCTFSRTTASTTSTNNTAPRTHREYHEPVRGKSSPHPEGGGPPWMKTPHDEPRWSFSAGKCRNPDFVSEFQFRVGGVSVFQVRVGAQGACGEGSTRRRVWVSRMTHLYAAEADLLSGNNARRVQQVAFQTWSAGNDTSGADLRLTRCGQDHTWTPHTRRPQSPNGR